MSTVSTANTADGRTTAAQGNVVMPKQRSRLAIAGYRALTAVALVVVWDLVLRLGLVTSTFIPSPGEVVLALVRLAGADLVRDVGITMYEASAGFVLGTIVGVTVGMVLGTLPRLNEIIAPFITTLNSMPRLALAPVFVLWFGIGATSHIALAFSLVVFIITVNTIAGAVSVDRDWLTLARLLGARRWEVVTKIMIPATIPWIVAAMRLAWAYALSAAIVGEMFLGQGGLGFIIARSSGTFDLAETFAGLGVAVVFAWLVDNAIRLGERKLLRWQPSVEVSG
jgi:NitT/TauT family transport system permease protein